MEHIDKEKIYALYEKAFEEAKTPLYRNNIRLMRMVWRYTDLELSENLFYKLKIWSNIAFTGI